MVVGGLSADALHRPAAAQTGECPFTFEGNTVEGAAPFLAAVNWQSSGFETFSIVFNWGDGSAPQQFLTPSGEAVHTYEDPDTYPVTATVLATFRDEEGNVHQCTAAGTIAIFVVYELLASFTSSLVGPPEPVNTILLTSTSTPSDKVVDYRWQTPNGVLSGNPVTITIPCSPTPVPVQLTVFDANGASSTRVQPVDSPCPDNDVDVRLIIEKINKNQKHLESGNVHRLDTWARQVGTAAAAALREASEFFADFGVRLLKNIAIGAVLAVGLLILGGVIAVESPVILTTVILAFVIAAATGQPPPIQA